MWWRSRALAVMMVAMFFLENADDVGAKVFLTQEQALELAFPGCEVERRTVFLTADQQANAADLADVEVGSKLVYPYEARCDGKYAGTAYFDTHRVRTLPETVMIVIDAESRLVRIEVVEFREPEDYIPRREWYDQFDGEELDDELQLDRSIRGVTGATLTARAATDAARRVLALHSAISRTSDPPVAAE